MTQLLITFFSFHLMCSDQIYFSLHIFKAFMMLEDDVLLCSSL